MLNKKLINKIYGYSLVAILALIVVEFIGLTLICLWSNWTTLIFIKIMTTNLLLGVPVAWAAMFYYL